MKLTRKQKAAELMKLIEDGPILSSFTVDEFTTEEAQAQTRLWLASWVRPLVEDLVPELKEPRHRFSDTLNY